MDYKRLNINERERMNIDDFSINKMFYLRFKLMNFINNTHDLICTQVND